MCENVQLDDSSDGRHATIHELTGNADTRGMASTGALTADDYRELLTRGEELIREQAALLANPDARDTDLQAIRVRLRAHMAALAACVGTSPPAC